MLGQVHEGASHQFRAIASFELLDINQQKNTRINPDEKPLSLFLFLSPECPLCQNYTLTINGLQQKFNQLNVYGIIPGNAYTVEDAVNFQNKYHTRFKILIDSKLKFTHYLKATITPQAILLDSKGNLLYTGAIDDWVQGLGKKRTRATRNYVQDAIEQTLQQTPVKVQKMKAFGCKINDY